MLLQPRSDVSEFKRRYRFMALVVLMMLFTLLGRLFQLQVLEGSDYRAMARENIVRRVTIPTTRGVVRDAYGRVLASSRPAYNVQVIPGRVLQSARPKTRRRRRDDQDTFPMIADTLRLNPEERAQIEARMREACTTDDDRSPCWRPIVVREDVSRDIVAEVKQHPQETSGAEVISVPVRYYPYKNVASHLLGYVGEIDKERLDRFRPEGFGALTPEERQNLNPLNYDSGDIVGATGIERSWESHLRGQRGWEKRIVDAHGRYRTGPEAQRLIEDPPRQEPISGRNLILTVDIDLTAAIEKAMRVHLSGAVVAVDVKTGRILAMYSKPDFDPNDLSGGGGRARLRETMNKLAKDSLRPLLDKTMTGAFQPGSTFKPFSALAALERKRVDPEHYERCDGFVSFGHRIFRCSHVHGRVNMRDAIAESCNVYFFNLAQAVDLDPIASIASEFGLGQKTGLGINPEAPGNIPTRSWYALRYRGQFRTGFTLNTSIGQGATTVTPLSLALAYGALANGGTVFIPQIVRAVETADGAIAQDFAPRVKQKAQVAPENLARVVDGLHAVVNDPKGTAYPVRDPYLDISGKTGTAQTGYVANGRDDPRQAWYYARDHAWFAAFAPAKSPEIAVIVLVEHGGSGPTQAAPVAMQIVREYTRLQAVRNHTAPPTPLTKEDKAGQEKGRHPGGHH
jgi:penicillin-binding protein 2